MKTKQAVIFGVGDFARVAWAYLNQDSPYQIAAFTVHQEYLREERLLDCPVVPFEGLITSHPPGEYELLVAVGFKRINRLRAEIYEQCKARGYRLLSYVSSRALLVGPVEIGDNCFILEGNVVQPFTRIGDDVVLWSGNHIGHDAVIGDHCFIASHAVLSGRSQIGPRCFIGVNATIGDGVQVAEDCVIGAGALILTDTAAQEVYAAARTLPAKLKSTDLMSFQ